MSRLSASHGRELVNNNQRRKVSSLNYDGAKLSAAGCQPTMWMINTIAAITNKRPLSLPPPADVSLSLVVKVEYPPGENAPIPPFLFLSELADSSCILTLSCPDFFFTLTQSQFDLEEGEVGRGGVRGSDSSLLTQHGANNLFSPLAIMQSIHGRHAPSLKVTFCKGWAHASESLHRRGRASRGLVDAISWQKK